MIDTSANQQFMTLFAQHARPVYAYIMTLVANQDDADEVFQETSAAVWENFSQFEPGTDFRAWACRVAYFKVLTFRQRKRRAPLAFGDKFIEVVDGLANERADELEARRRALADCYGKLGDRDRELIDRRYQTKATAAEVADQVGRSLDHVYKSLRRIYGQLFDCINRKVAEEER